MKKEIADKWVEALRSGKYKQGTRRLYDPPTNSYCCLGVLCEIQGVKTLTEQGDTLELPQDKNKVGLKTSGASLEGMPSLWVLNDGDPVRVPERLTFDEIADIIQIAYKDL